MKISIESAAASYLKTTKVGATNTKAGAVAEPGRKFDQIMINSNSKRIAEEKLTEAAKKDIENAVFKSNTEEKIQRLKEQVAEGMYKVDPEAVAAKILLLGGIG